MARDRNRSTSEDVRRPVLWCSLHRHWQGELLWERGRLVRDDICRAKSWRLSTLRWSWREWRLSVSQSWSRSSRSCSTASQSWAWSSCRCPRRPTRVCWWFPPPSWSLCPSRGAGSPPAAPPVWPSRIPTAAGTWCLPPVSPRQHSTLFMLPSFYKTSPSAATGSAGTASPRSS